MLSICRFATFSMKTTVFKANKIAKKKNKEKAQFHLKIAIKIDCYRAEIC